MLEVENLSVGYIRPVVRRASFRLEAGRLGGILGRNGSGKTTLLRGICGAARVYEGAVRVEGQDCLGLSARKRAEKIALLPQRSPLPRGLRAGEVIRMGRYIHGSPFRGPGPGEEAMARRAAESLGIGELWGKDCALLSEGQRQLVQLARALAQDAPLLLLDEPTSALDPENAQLLFRQLRRLTQSRNKAALAVVHDPALALRWCDRLYCMREGVLTGGICPTESSPQQIQDFLRQIWPQILVKKDKETGLFYSLLA